ncbi:ABC transporter ATP-binding protein [Bordetella sp. N]|uniref:ABC transporter ATP-binding protein n=1 Tax=Bordetella sp. N TaxID=1746199 RepID=UPI000AF7041C|nr:ABC transporter ATP-binding protein [Bordetella sp. N]
MSADMANRPPAAAAGETVLDVRGLAVEIPTTNGLLRPVRGVDLSVAAGETLAIVGESGCGKSLTSLAIMGLLPRHARVTAQTIALKGATLQGLSDRDWRKLRGNRMAMIFQDPMTALDPCYRIGDQMVEVLRQHRKVSRADAIARCLSLLRQVGISSPEQRLEQYPHQLSGGLRQRVMIAMALSCEPELIIADEPTTALDVTIQAQILHLLARIQRETGIGLVLITHDLGVVAGIADRVAVMYGGQVVETGSCMDVLTRPLHPYTEGLLRSIPVPGATRRGELLGYIPGVVPRQTGELTRCGFMERCPYANAACAAGPVALRVAAVDGAGRQAPHVDHTVRCVLPLDGSGRAADAWQRHTQGGAVATEPVVVEGAA